MSNDVIHYAVVRQGQLNSPPYIFDTFKSKKEAEEYAERLRMYVPKNMGIYIYPFFAMKEFKNDGHQESNL